MTRRSRRAVLGLSGAMVAGLAGCRGLDSSGSDDEDEPTAGTSATDAGDSMPGRESIDAADGPGALRLEPAEPPSEGSVVVYPSNLQGWLREAGTTDDVVRGHARTGTYRPTPPLHAFDRVRLVDESGDADGWFRIEGESGIRYEYSATAVEATPSDGATVTPVSDLSGARRDLAEAAIEAPFSDGSRFYPETQLGEWARNEFFGGYYRYDGTVYQGMERQQTDAAFFSEECFYVIDLVPVDGGPGPELRLGALDEHTRQAVDAALAAALSRRTTVDEPATPSRQGAETVTTAGYLLSHTAVFSVALGGEG
jgi:hypothetical protein